MDLRTAFSSEEQGLEMMRVCAQGPGPRRMGGKGGKGPAGLSSEEFVYVCLDWQLGTPEEARMLFDKMMGAGPLSLNDQRPLGKGGKQGNNGSESPRFKESSMLTHALVSDITVHLPPWAQ